MIAGKENGRGKKQKKKEESMSKLEQRVISDMNRNSINSQVNILLYLYCCCCMRLA